MEDWKKQIVERANLASRAAAAKKATDIVLLDMEGLSTVTDIFMICGAANERQIKAIADEIEAQVQPASRRRFRRDGTFGSPWLVLDLGGILVHIFLEEERQRLELEKLWGDAPRLATGNFSGESEAEN